MKRILIAGVLLLCLTISQVAQAAEARDAQIKAQMVENYLLWQEAYKFMDAERIISFESPDFVAVVKDGTVLTKRDADAAWRGTMKTFQKVYDAKVDIKKVTIESNRVTVLSTHFIDADIRRGDRLHRTSATFHLRDTWVQYDRVWMLKRTEHLKTSIYFR